eukprot:UN02890
MNDGGDDGLTLYYDEQGKGHNIINNSLARPAAKSVTISNIYSVPSESQVQQCLYFYDMIRMVGVIISIIMSLFYLGWLIFGTWMIATHKSSICSTSGNSSYIDLFTTEIILYWVSFVMLVVIGVVGIYKYK